MFHEVSLDLGGRKLTLETGKMARQAHGAIVARYGDSVVLATACMDTHASTEKPDHDNQDHKTRERQIEAARHDTQKAVQAFEAWIGMCANPRGVPCIHFG